MTYGVGYSPSLFLLHIQCSIPRAASPASHRKRSRFFAGNGIFLPINDISLSDKFSLWQEDLLFSSQLWTTWKGFSQLEDEDNCVSGWDDFKTWTLCSRRQEVRPSRREEILRNQVVALCLSVFSLTQQCGVMSFHQPPVQKSRMTVNLRTTFC